MTAELTRLRTSLIDVFRLELDLPAVPKALNDEIERLKRLVGEAGSVRPSKDRIKEAVASFRQTGKLANLGQARLTCFGCIERFAPTQTLLIEDAEAFPILLAEVDKYARESRAFRRCYRGLLHNYFKYEQDRVPEDSAGGRNWRRLQSYLEARVKNIRVDGMQPNWAAAIVEHRNLLTRDPVARYGAALLRGNTQEFQSARNSLEIDGDSWVLRKVVLAQVRAAIGQSDEQFRQFVDGLLTLLGEYPLQRDEGLGLVLDRYAAMHSCPEHVRLRDAAIDAWGSPWMTTRDAAWQRVKPESRAMVHGWLNLKLIQQFFDVLSEDRRTDQRRVRFWKKYYQHIDEIYFALGPTAANSRSADIRQLRKDMGPHLLWLRGGDSDNNAFIMRIGDYVIVEFGLSGNACFIFRSDHLPFQLRGELAGDRTELKHDSQKERLEHRDGGYENWEDKFESTLGRLGIRPQAHPRAKPAYEARQVDVPEPAVREQISERGRAEKSQSTQRPYSLQALRELSEAHGLQTKDMTQVGGRLWVFRVPKTGAIADRLIAWGFRWANAKNGWYRNKRD